MAGPDEHAAIMPPGLGPQVTQITAVVPTIGRSRWLLRCLAALRAQRGPSLEIVVVDQAATPLAIPPHLADQVLRPAHNLGFAGGTNYGIKASRSMYVATVNDDVIVAPDWLAMLIGALDAEPTAAAAQGMNLIMPSGDSQLTAATADCDGAVVDGCGLGWNTWWQAIQLGHGAPAPHGGGKPGGTPPGATHQGTGTSRANAGLGTSEIFGVSATAALYRRSALERAAIRGEAFDLRLESYYEDAELAGRLRAAGYCAILLSAALAHHVGSASSLPTKLACEVTPIDADSPTGATLAGGRPTAEINEGASSSHPVTTNGAAAPSATAARARWRLIYGNRYLAAARLLGGSFWRHLPRMVLRDCRDLIPRRDTTAEGAGIDGGAKRRAAPAPADGGAAARWALATGILQGWGRAVRLLPAFARRGAASPPVAEVIRLSHNPLEPR